MKPILAPEDEVTSISQELQERTSDENKLKFERPMGPILDIVKDLGDKLLRAATIGLDGVICTKMYGTRDKVLHGPM